VLKIATFAKPQTVMRKLTDTETMKTNRTKYIYLLWDKLSFMDKTPCNCITHFSHRTKKQTCPHCSTFCFAPPHKPNPNKTKRAAIFQPHRHLCMLTILFCLTTICFAQNSQSLLIDNQVEMFIPRNSADWDRINEMKMLRNNFPSLAPQYNQQIGQILDWYISAYNPTNPSQDIARQQQKKAMQVMGQTPPPTQADIAAQQQRQQQGKAPELTSREKVMNEMTSLLKEAEQKSKANSEANYYNSPEFLTDQPNYITAKNFIQEMLDGKRPLSIKEAFFMSEYAFGNLLLTHDEYNKLIASNANFIKQWLKEKGYNLTDPEALHFGIQKFMSDTLYIHVDGKLVGHMPYYYDYIDFKAKDDLRNYFVTKTLATGTGQCHTFPVTYLILAEALGVEANIAYNPKHSFIRYKNKKGTTINYETTVDRFLGDAFYLQTLPIMATAQKNKIYAHSILKKQLVATVLYELASNFIREHWLADKKFVRECMQIAKPHFPNQTYICNSECGLQKQLYAETINEMIQQKGITDANEIQKHPDIMKAFSEYYAYMDIVNKLGIQEAPEAEELRMMEYYDKKGRLQIAKKINAKEKRTLFIN
jgi:hypothetical protein